MQSMPQLVRTVQADPHVALVLPAFDVPTLSNGTSSETSTVPLSKVELSRLWRGGHTEAFAARQYPMGHACDETTAWMGGAQEMIPTSYRFGCEPYLLVSRRFAPRYDESFVSLARPLPEPFNFLLLDF